MFTDTVAAIGVDEQLSVAVRANTGGAAETHITNVSLTIPAKTGAIVSLTVISHSVVSELPTSSSKIHRRVTTYSQSLILTTASIGLTVLGVPH